MNISKLELDVEVERSALLSATAWCSVCGEWNMKEFRQAKRWVKEAKERLAKAEAMLEAAEKAERDALLAP